MTRYAVTLCTYLKSGPRVVRTVRPRTDDRDEAVNRAIRRVFGRRAIYLPDAGLPRLRDRCAARIAAGMLVPFAAARSRC